MRTEHRPATLSPQRGSQALLVTCVQLRNLSQTWQVPSTQLTAGYFPSSAKKGLSVPGDFIRNSNIRALSGFISICSQPKIFDESIARWTPRSGASASWRRLEGGGVQQKCSCSAFFFFFLISGDSAVRCDPPETQLGKRKREEKKKAEGEKEAMAVFRLRQAQYEFPNGSPRSND